MAIIQVLAYRDILLLLLAWRVLEMVPSQGKSFSLVRKSPLRVFLMLRNFWSR